MTTKTALALVRVPFEGDGDTLEASLEGDRLWVSIRRVCEALGLAVQRQLAKLKDKPWATVTFKVMVADDGKARRVACLDLDSLPMWLATIEASRVAKALRPKLLAYQREAARVLRDHFFGRRKGVAMVAAPLPSAERPGRLFKRTLAEMLIAVANANKSARAERLAREVAPDAISPEIDLKELPKKLADGRALPRTRAQLVENVLHNLHARGRLPPHPDLSLKQIKHTARLLAELNKGTGCHVSLAFLEREKDTSPSQFRAACVYLERAGLMLNFPRVKADDRKIGGAQWPLTEARTTIRVLCGFPFALTHLSEDEVMDLIAGGPAKPTSQIVAALTSGEGLRVNAALESGPRPA